MNRPHQPATQHTPAETGLWLFILADMCIFALYFGVFAWDKHLHPEQFAAGQATLSTALGGANTIILLVSSYCMAKAVHAARRAATANYARYIALTIGCGCAFLIIKAFEYTGKISAGHHIDSNLFYRDYFAFTGLHMLHVIIGLCLLAYAWRLGQSTSDAHGHARFIEGTGLYWHMVDLLWVVLFALIYLVP